jgi:hypothetical protein
MPNTPNMNHQNISKPDATPLKFNEALLQFIWQHKLWQTGTLTTSSGKAIRVISTGILNKENGPDFFNAAVAIDEVELHGNIEIHIKTSDWLKHGHQNDARYDKIILHVVYDHDMEVPQNKTFSVEVLELKHSILPETIKHYSDLMTARQTLACETQLKMVPEEKIKLWLQRMLSERLQEKSRRMEELFIFNGSNLQQTFFTILLRAFGFKSNSHAFELMAKHLPVEIVLRYCKTPFQLEALFLGMCGLLDELMLFPYGTLLQNEFEAMQKRHQLVPLQKHILTTGGVRPSNAPALRLAQLAAFVHTHAYLLEQPENAELFLVFKKTISVRASSFWESHYNLSKTSALQNNPVLGKASIESLVINAIAPHLFFLGKLTEQESLCEQAITLLDGCSFEKNKKTNLYLNNNITYRSASQSQGFIHLHDNYCRVKKCLSCSIGLTILRK